MIDIQKFIQSLPPEYKKLEQEIEAYKKEYISYHQPIRDKQAVEEVAKDTENFNLKFIRYGDFLVTKGSFSKAYLLNGPIQISLGERRSSIVGQVPTEIVKFELKNCDERYLLKLCKDGFYLTQSPLYLHRYENYDLAAVKVKKFSPEHSVSTYYGDISRYNVVCITMNTSYSNDKIIIADENLYVPYGMGEKVFDMVMEAIRDGYDKLSLDSYMGK